MNSFKWLSILILISFVCYMNTAKANSVAFNKAQLAQVKADYLGKKWLMLLWSVECPPCFKELAILQTLQKEHDNLAVVIINTDADNELAQERKAIIKKFELNRFSHFHFVAGKADQSRFWVDPNWYGELPRSYFIEPNGTFHGKSGLVNKSLLTQWLLP